MNTSKYIVLGIILSTIIVITLDGCHPGAPCTSLPRTYCGPVNVFTCGCFDVQKMVGGVTGGSFDATSSRSAIVLRPDSVVEYYSHDSLGWRAKIESITKNAKRNSTELTLAASRIGITFSGSDTMVVWEKGVKDGTNYLYVRNLK